MASPHIKPLSRRLSEVLEEQQEPFFLDSVYSERAIQSQAASLCWRLSDRCFWRRRGAGGARRCLPSKLRCWEVVKRALNWIDTAPHYRRLGLTDCFPVVGRKRVGWKECELSPVSVLDLYSDEDPSVHNHSSPVEIEEENQSISSLNSSIEDGKEAKREVPLPSQEPSGDRMEERTRPWESQWGDLALITNLICLDFSESRNEWSQFQDQRREIRVQIEGLILEELREECVMDMVRYHCTMFVKSRRRL